MTFCIISIVETPKLMLPQREMQVQFSPPLANQIIKVDRRREKASSFNFGRQELL